MHISLRKTAANTVLDSLILDRCGVIAVVGWTRVWEPLDPVELWIDGRPAEPGDCHRIFRPDVARHLGVSNGFHGFAHEFLRFERLERARVEVRVCGKAVWQDKVSFDPAAPHYVGLLWEPKVLSRDEIYSSGPPLDFIPAEIERLAEFARGKVLDFGCGRGNLVRHLRQQGQDAFGIEIDRPAIRAALLPEVASYIHLYHGELPLPYPDAAFDCACAVEVIEHVPDYRAALAEIVRVAARRVIVTVPDISAIPRSAPEHVVPWHLLEATHYNFFTARSLSALLAPHFERITLVKIGPVGVNDSHYFTSLAAICDKQGQP